MSTYSEKLRDPRWQRVRLEVMNRDGFRCLRCGDDKSTLNVHHLKYAKDPWDAPPEHLETLCETCHGWRTEINEKFQLMPTASVPEMVTIGLGIGPMKDSQMAMLFHALSEIQKFESGARAVSVMEGRPGFETAIRLADQWRGFAVRILTMGKVTM